MVILKPILFYLLIILFDGSVVFDGSVDIDFSYCFALTLVLCLFSFFFQGVVTH